MPLCPKCKFQWTSTERSGQQNRAYFGIAVQMLAEQSNCSIDRMHKALAGEFLGYDTVRLPNGKQITVPKTTRTLTTVEFSNYIERIQRWAAENGIVIPDPNETDQK